MKSSKPDFAVPDAMVFFRDKNAALGAASLAAVVLFSLVVPWFGGNAYLSDFSGGHDLLGDPIGPSAHHWLGADRLFRDEAIRLAIAGRHSLRIGIVASFLAGALGTLIGTIAGWYAEPNLGSSSRILRFIPNVDTILSFCIDVGLSFPFLLLVMSIAAVAERTSELTIILTLGFSGWLGTARLVRSKVLELRTRDFITAARAFGQSTIQIFIKHLFPNLFSTFLVTTTLAVGQMIVAEAALSWLGAGLAPPEPSWGRMLAEGEEAFPASPWLVIAPAVMLLVTALGANLLGEALRDRWERTAASTPSAVPTGNMGGPPSAVPPGNMGGPPSAVPPGNMGGPPSAVPTGNMGGPPSAVPTGNMGGPPSAVPPPKEAR